MEAEGIADQVDPIQYAIRLLVPPGSAPLSRPALRPFLGARDPAAFTYRWTHPDPRMDRLHRDVSALVQHAADASADPGVTFQRVRSLALAGREPAPGAYRPPAPG